MGQSILVSIPNIKRLITSAPNEMHCSVIAPVFLSVHVHVSRHGNLSTILPMKPSIMHCLSQGCDSKLIFVTPPSCVLDSVRRHLVSLHVLYVSRGRMGVHSVFEIYYEENI